MKLKVGDKVAIKGAARRHAAWEDLEAEVVDAELNQFDEIKLKPLAPRPDKFQFEEFYWEADDLLLVEGCEYKLFVYQDHIIESVAILAKTKEEAIKEFVNYAQHLTILKHYPSEEDCHKLMMHGIEEIAPGKVHQFR